MLTALRFDLPLWAITVATGWLPDHTAVARFRGWLARPFIGQCGPRFELGAHVTLLCASRLKIGSDVYIARGSWLNSAAGITLESEVMLGPYVVISSLKHTFRNGSARYAPAESGPVTIGHGSWLAAHSVVGCGVTLGPGTLLAANSAAVRSSPGGTLLGGVPAVAKRQIVGRCDAVA